MTLSPGLSSTQLDKTFNVRDLVNRLKDLKCKVCSKTFITKDHLDGHMKIHDEEKEEVIEKQADLPRETEVESSKETEVESSKEAEVESSKETEVHSSKETKVESFKQTKVKSSWETKVDSSKKAEVKSSKETEVVLSQNMEDGRRSFVSSIGGGNTLLFGECYILPNVPKGRR